MNRKVVVVVEGKEIYFTGYEGLTVINKGKHPISATTMKVSKGFGIYDEEPVLILRAKVNGQDDVIAVFKKWDYWREIEEARTQDDETLPYVINKSTMDFYPVFHTDEDTKTAIRYDEKYQLFFCSMRGGYTMKLSEGFLNELIKTRDLNRPTQAPLTSHEKEIIKAELRKDKLYRESVMEYVLSNLTNDQLTGMRKKIADLTAP